MTDLFVGALVYGTLVLGVVWGCAWLLALLIEWRMT